jgi:hypothetical protein
MHNPLHTVRWAASTTLASVTVLGVVALLAMFTLSVLFARVAHALLWLGVLAPIALAVPGLSGWKRAFAVSACLGYTVLGAMWAVSQ